MRLSGRRLNKPCGSVRTIEELMAEDNLLLNPLDQRNVVRTVVRAKRNA